MSETSTVVGSVEHGNSSPSLEQLAARLDNARRARAKVEFRQMGRSRDSLSEVERLTLEAYESARTEYGVASLKDLVDAVESDVEKNAIVIGYLFEEQNRLNSEIKDPSEQSLMDRARRLGRGALRSVGNWLTSGSKKAQFVKSMVVTGTAATIGGLSGGVLTAGIMGVTRYASGLAKGLAVEVDQITSTQEEIKQHVGEVDFESVREALIRASQIMQAERSQNIKNTQERNRLAQRKGFAAFAVGAVVGTTIGSAIHYGSDLFSTSAHAVEPLVDPVNNHITTGQVDILSSHDTTGDINIPSGHDTTGTVDIPGSHETTGTVDIPSNHETTDAVEIPGTHDTTGTVDIPGSHETTGTVDIPGDHEIEIHFEPFEVQYGHGYTHEIIETARANGVELTPQEAWKWHKDIVDAAGRDYIDLHDFNGNDVYSMGDSKYEVGISSPSENATWSVKAQEILEEKLKEKLAAAPDISHLESGLPTAGVSEAATGFDFGYGASPEVLLEKVASNQLGYDLNGEESYLLINHLMHETNGKIFEGVSMHWSVLGNDAWISDAGGSTSGLTEQAKEIAKEWLARRGTLVG